jgi:Rrf2 family protein
VKLSIKSDYAARAVLGLARGHAGLKAVRVADLAGSLGIPANYLAQILLELRADGIVRSQRGKEGGYLLARAPSEISLGDVLRCVHGTVLEPPALEDPRCPPELQVAWKRLRNALEQTADAITFERLLDEDAARDKMYYI